MNAKNLKMMKFWDDLAGDGTWASHYDGKPNLRTYNFYTRRAAVLKLLENDGDFGCILDLGCGTGDYAELAIKHKGRYVGIDYAEEMIVQAVQRHRKASHPSHFQVGSGDSLPYRSNQFDLIVAMGYIEYFENPRITLAEIQRVLKPGGTLVLQSYKRELFTKLDNLFFNRLFALIGKPVPRPRLPESWVNKQYSKGELDRLLREFGFKCSSSVFNNFYTLPGRLRIRYQDLYIRLSELLNKAAPNLFGFLATNYVARYILEKPAENGISMLTKSELDAKVTGEV